jgi:excinuclease UvrABC ATPase subunit
LIPTTKERWVMADEEDEERITTPGNMTWVPCDHVLSVKDRFGKCEACRGTGRMLIMVDTTPAVEARKHVL